MASGIISRRCHFRSGETAEQRVGGETADADVQKQRTRSTGPVAIGSPKHANAEGIDFTKCANAVKFVSWETNRSKRKVI